VNNQIEIRIEGKVTAEKFKTAVSAFFELIENVSADVCAGRFVEWLVEVDHGSAIIRAHTECTGERQ
jgi:hypothetical protein